MANGIKKNLSKINEIILLFNINNTCVIWRFIALQVHRVITSKVTVMCSIVAVVSMLRDLSQGSKILSLIQRLWRIYKTG